VTASFTTSFAPVVKKVAQEAWFKVKHSDQVEGKWTAPQMGAGADDYSSSGFFGNPSGSGPGGARTHSGNGRRSNGVGIGRVIVSKGRLHPERTITWWMDGGQRYRWS